MLWRKSCNFAAILLLCSVQIVLILAENYPQYKSSNVNNELVATKEEVSEGEGRFLASLYFPFLPQYENVNYGKILKFLTAPTTVAAFLGRHVISTLGAMLFWLFLHTIFWNGKAKTTDDLPFPFSVAGVLLDNPQAFTGNLAIGRKGLAAQDRQSEDFYQTSFDGTPEAPSDIEKSYFPERYEPDQAQDRLNSESLGSVSANGLYNFLVKPDNSAFNLILELSFATVGMMLWLAPTFLWNGQERPTTDVTFGDGSSDKRREDDIGTQIESKFGRIVTKVENSADVVQVYNDLFCANCVARLFTIFTLGLTAKFIFWFIITLLPKDWPDIFFNQQGLTINNDRRSFGGEDLFYNPWNHSLKRNVEEAVLFFLDEIDDKMDIVNRGIL